MLTPSFLQFGEQLELDFDAIKLPTAPAKIRKKPRRRAASAETRKKPKPKGPTASAKTEEKPTTTGKSLRQKRVAQEDAAREEQGFTITEFPPYRTKSRKRRCRSTRRCR